MAKKVCPDCGCDKFKVVVLERHDWIVDGDGDFIEDDGCYEANIADWTEWTCVDCGATFNNNLDLVDPDEEQDDFDPPDDYDDPKDAFERMTDLEIRYNG